jgi:hypothetical protein
MRRPRLFLISLLVAGAAGPAADPSVAQGAPPAAGAADAEPSTVTLAVLPSTSVVLRAAADATGVYACVYDPEHRVRSLVHRRVDGVIETLAVARIDQLAIDDDRVYWVGEDGVQAIDKHGGAVQMLAPRDTSLLLGPAPETRPAIVLDAADVYFSIDDGVGRVSKRGGDAQLLASAVGATLVGVDSTDAWWLEPVLGGGKEPTLDDVHATPKHGGKSRLVLDDVPGVLAMSVDDDGVYWLGETQHHGHGSLQRASTRTGETVKIVDDVPTYYGGGHVLALTGANLFWLEYPEGLHGPMRIRGVPKDGGQATTVVEPFPPANQLFVDQDRVYWAQDGIRAVVRAH